jgi:hypothetical protein
MQWEYGWLVGGNKNDRKQLQMHGNGQSNSNRIRTATMTGAMVNVRGG